MSKNVGIAVEEVISSHGERSFNLVVLVESGKKLMKTENIDNIRSWYR